MFKKISIQLNQSLICGGLAILEKDGQDLVIYFDIVKISSQIIVGGRGKSISVMDADFYERELSNFFRKHRIPLELGTYQFSA